MPTYTFTCDVCGREEDLVVHMDQRTEPQKRPHDCADGLPCDGTFRRDGSVLEVTAFTPYSWKP